MPHLSKPPPSPTPVRVVAVVGSDGAGKSTLAAALYRRLQAEGHAVASIYLGQSSGRIAAWIGDLPVLGAALAARLKRKAARIHADQRTAPGAATLLTIWLLSRWRAYKFRRMLARTRRGVLVIADRYPQAEVPGFRFDGPELPRLRADGWLARRLGTSEQRLYQRMASHTPLLVIRLNIDAATAHARKPDHPLDLLQAKTTMLPQLQFHGARIVDLDGRSAAAEVLDAACAAVHLAMGVARG